MTAWIEGRVCGQAHTRQVGGQVVYAIHVSSEEQVVGCGAPGKQVSFKIGSQWMEPSAAWDNARLWNLPLRPATSASHAIFLPVLLKNK